MTWNVPDLWPFVLLALAAWRVFRLIAEDTILDRPRSALLHRLDRPRGGGKFEAFITCPFCAGAHVSVAWWLAWLAWPHWTLVAATPFALSAVVALVAVHGDPD